MATVNKWNGMFREIIQKIVHQIKLWQMDKKWYYTGASSWKLFPPSFYYTHSEEEARRITAEAVGRIQELINKIG